MENNEDNRQAINWWESLSKVQKLDMEQEHIMLVADVGAITDFVVKCIWEKEGKPQPVEDNGQTTVIAAEIKRQKTELKKLRRKHSVGHGGDYAWYERCGAITAMEKNIKALESLLPKEKEELIQMHVAGQLHADRSKANRIHAESAFNQTFKTT